MSINDYQLEKINDFLKNFPSAKLQIVTKNQDTKTIKDLIARGYCLFGENKVQEADEKYKNLELEKLDLHLIGPLQTNKVRLALDLFNTIQSIDREKLVREIVKVKNKFKTKTSNFNWLALILGISFFVLGVFTVAIYRRKSRQLQSGDSNAPAWSLVEANPSFSYTEVGGDGRAPPWSLTLKISRL